MFVKDKTHKRDRKHTSFRHAKNSSKKSKKDSVLDKETDTCHSPSIEKKHKDKSSRTVLMLGRGITTFPLYFYDRFFISQNLQKMSWRLSPVNIWRIIADAIKQEVRNSYFSFLFWITQVFLFRFLLPLCLLFRQDSLFCINKVINKWTNDWSKEPGNGVQ
jgi:hypothetical protein